MKIKDLSMEPYQLVLQQVYRQDKIFSASISLLIIKKLMKMGDYCLVFLLYLWGYQSLLAQPTLAKAKFTLPDTSSHFANGVTHIQQPNFPKDSLPDKNNAGSNPRLAIAPNRDSSWLDILPSFPGYSKASYPRFKHLTPNEGLSQGFVKATLKDRKGFMWFGTNEGLNKYDGYTFTAYKHDAKKPESISGNFVHDVIEDQAGNVWVGTARGLDRFDRRTDAFVHYTPTGKSIYIESIFQDSQKRMWIGSKQGLYLFHPDKGTFQHYPHREQDPNSLSHNDVYQIAEDNEGNLWIGTQEGLNRFNPKTQRFICYRHDPHNPNSISSSWITSVYKDSKGRIWAGTLGGGVVLFDRKQNAFINFRHNPVNGNSVAHNDVLSLVEGNDGKLWIGTENGGISVFDYENNHFVTYQHDVTDNTSLSNNSVHSLYKDDIGNIWAGTWSGGVNFLPRYGNKFVHFKHIPTNPNSLSHNSVTTITGDKDGNIWIGTDGGGLNLLDRKRKRILHYRNDPHNPHSIKSNYIISTTEVDKDIIALAYHRVGFDLLNRKTGKVTHLPEDSEDKLGAPLAKTSGTKVYKDLWLGTNYSFGLYYYDRRTKLFTHYLHNPQDKNSISDGVIMSLLEDKEGNLWVGMAPAPGSGLDYFDRKNKRFIHYRHDPSDPYSLSHNMVSSIMEDRRGNLWLGTPRGLNFFDKKNQRFTAYTEKDGLANNVIYGIMEDQKRNLWLSSNKGITKFNPFTKACRNYNISDGLQDNTFQHQAWYQTPQGEMFFGGINGFNVFHPDSIRDNPIVPPVALTDLLIFNKPVPMGENSPLPQHISETRELTLSYQHSVFTFEFAALNFTLPEKNQYAYQLEGFDQDWNYIGTRRTATYTNLDAGTYTFRVKATNNDGVWNEQGTSLVVHILPPWWETWWFRVAAIVTLVGMSIGYYKIRMNKIKQQNKWLEQSVLEQTKELRLANEEIREINKEMAVRDEAIQTQNEELSLRNEELVHRQEEIATQRDLLADQNRKLNEARKIIEAHNQTLDKEVKERTKELVEYNQQLEQFAFIAAHNLRAPVARILGLGQILELSKNNHEEKKMIVDKLIFTTEELDRVVKDINTILVIQKSTTLAISEINLTEELNLIKTLLYNEITDTQAEIREDFSQANIIHTVKPYLESILLNLISNAIKYRQPTQKPCIYIKTEIQDGYVCLLIKDNGLGIDLLHHQKNIFNLYKRFHSHVEGKGMGLYLVKTQVVALGGKIEVESQVNLGTTFKVFLKNDITTRA